MGHQTTESLIERKLRPWLNRGLITKPQFVDLVAYSVKQGFWEALGRTTKTKYANLRNSNLVNRTAVEGHVPTSPEFNPARRSSPFEFLTVFISKRELLQMDYVSQGIWSDRNQKRHRVWTNGNYLADGTPVLKHLQERYPGWTVIRVNVKQGIYVLRRAREAV